MTNTGDDTHQAENRADSTTPPETRLELNRGILQQRLRARPPDPVSGLTHSVGRLTQTTVPLARRAVRQYPYASLAGAMLAGIILIRWKPWRGLAGSVLVGLVARQAFTLLTSPGGDGLKWLMAATRLILPGSRGAEK